MYWPGRTEAPQVNTISLHAQFVTGSARFRKAFADDEDGEDQSINGTALITSLVNAHPPVADKEQDYRHSEALQSPLHIASAVKTFWTEKYGELMI